jgi:hypothetical protein
MKEGLMFALYSGLFAFGLLIWRDAPTPWLRAVGTTMAFISVVNARKGNS